MNTLGFLVKRHRVAWWFLTACIIAYLGICATIFVQWMNPSLDGRTDQHIAADSTTYMYMADVLRGGQRDPLVLAALASFPNTFWMPVLFAFVLKSTVLIALGNLALFWISIELFRRSSEINVGLFLFFLFLNPTTTVSLLSVNKEIVDLFVVALFCYFWTVGHKWVVFLALFLSLINRYEVCIAILIFIVIRSRLNPLRRRRLLMLFAVILGLNFFLPLLVSRILSDRFVEASGGQLVAFLDTLEMHYLYVFAVFPKILENMFGELLNVSHWSSYSIDDPANSYILFFNNFASMIVVLVLVWKRSLRISNDWIYFASIGAVVMSVSLVNQPRYFYFCFVLLCFQAAQSKMTEQRRPSYLPSSGKEIACA